MFDLPEFTALQARRANDPALDAAVDSAGMNASDLGLDRDEEWQAEVLRQVAGWEAAGREW